MEQYIDENNIEMIHKGIKRFSIYKYNIFHFLFRKIIYF